MKILTCLFLAAATGYLLVKADYTCYISSSPEAKTMSSVYDDQKDEGAFWFQSRSELDPCNFSSLYSSSNCSVCLDDSVRAEIILVVLFNLTSNVKLVFEGPDGNISFNWTNCPRPEPVSVSKLGTEPNNQKNKTIMGHPGGRTGLYAALFCFGSLIIIVISLAYRLYKSQQTPGNEAVSFDPQSGSVLINVPENGHAGPPAE